MVENYKRWLNISMKSQEMKKIISKIGITIVIYDYLKFYNCKFHILEI
jgi:hypothetical protein